MKKTFVNIIITSILLFAPFIAPIFKTDLNTGTLLTVVALLFAILVGFFIATASTNYLRLQTLVANEDSSLISVYNLCKIIDKKSIEKISNSIDLYTTKTLDYELSEYIEKTDNEFNKLIDEIDLIKIDDKMDSVVMSYLQQKKTELFNIRQEISLVSRSVISKRHWLIIISLASVLVTLLFTLRDGTFLADFITAVLTAATYFILVLIYQIDTNTFLEEKVAFMSSQRIFNMIGKMKYFPEYALKNKRAKKPNENYRVGYFENGIKKIKIVEV